MLTMETPTPERAALLWPCIEPWFRRCCEEAADGELDADDIRRLHAAGRCALFLGMEDEEVKIALAVEFIPYPKFTAANIFAIGGTGLFRREALRYWDEILARFRAAGVKAVDAWVGDGMRRLIEKRLGFKKTYNHLRKYINQEAME
jgi:hypothetical protein